MDLRRRLRMLFRPGTASALKKKGGNDPAPATLRRFPFIQERLDDWVIRKRFCEDIRSNEAFARSLGADPRDVESFFRHVVREDQRTWRIRLRIQEAKVLLEQNDMPSGAVAEAVGFSDASNFARQFRKETGCSPTEWRERHYGSRKTRL